MREELIEGMEIAGKYVEPKPMDIKDIENALKEWVHAVRMARLAGFDGVEIHVANGYLIESSSPNFAITVSVNFCMIISTIDETNLVEV